MKIKEFNDITEFKEFVYQLKNEDILAFSYREWNNLYDKINKLYNKLDIDNNLDELKNDFEKKHNQKGSTTSFSGKVFFANCLCGEEFVKLNMNFKLSSSDWNMAFNIAKSIAFELKDKNIDLASSLICETAKKQMIINIDKAALKATKYPNFYDDAYYFMCSKISISKECDELTRGTTKYKTHNAEINIDDMSDRIFNTSTHETIHAHFQQNTALQRYMKDHNIIAFGISKELSDLFENNQEYYIFTNNQFAKNVFGYSRQPIEYYAKLVGALAEREFRKLSKQYSERNFIMLNNYFCNCLNLDNPINARYNNNCIEVFYPIGCLEKIDNFRKKLPPELLNRIRVYKNEKLVKVSIDNGYDCGTLLEKHCKGQEKSKLISKSIKNSLLKKIPIIGIGIGAYLGIKRVIQNKKSIAIAPYEVLSGLFSSMDNGMGGIFSFGIDAVIYKYDEKQLKKSNVFVNDTILNAKARN